MAPSAVETIAVPAPTEEVGNSKLNIKQQVAEPAETDVEVPTQDEEARPERLIRHREPLKLSGALDQFEHFDVTPIIGREYVNANLAELLRAPNSDDLVRDLAITSRRSSVRETYS